MLKIINFIKSFKNRIDFLKIAGNRDSYFVTWNKHENQEGKKQYQLNIDLEFIPRITNQFFDAGVIFNFELEKAYSVRKLNNDSLGIAQIAFDDFIKDGWVILDDDE